MTKNSEYKILIIDDSPEDMETVKRLLSETDEESYLVYEADTGKEGLNALERDKIDCVLVDYMLPDYDGTELINIIRENSDFQDIPMILFTGYGTGPRAAAALKSGAQDYVPKDQFDTNILVRSIHYAIDKKQIEVARDKLIVELQKALDEVKMLSGILPICASCKKIRDDKGDWQHIEKYLRDHSEAEFTHGICPECAKRLYPDLDVKA
ncbi:MAG: response regulator [Planctomycetes bacterium]|nr:response regulator [Planctomycetota bacterium]